MRRIGALFALMGSALATFGAAPVWPARLDITVGPTPSSAGVTDLMVCVVGADGQGTCHHRDGVVRARATTPDGVACPGAEAPLRPACPGPAPCALTGVPVPAGPFGLLVLSIRPPVFGVPRHRIADAAILANPGPTPTAPDHGRLITGALAAVARCLAPSDAHHLRPDLPVVAVGDCATRACDLDRIRLRFAAGVRMPIASH